MSEPVRILHIVGAMYPGGVENFIMNLYRKMDRDKIQFDFAVHEKRENDYIPEIESMGGKVYVLPRLTKDPFGNLKQIYNLSRQYGLVIRHTANALVSLQLLAAKKAGSVTVCHAHSSDDPQKILHYAGRWLMRYSCDVRLACSLQAGKWMYGKRQEGKDILLEEGTTNKTKGKKSLQQKGTFSIVHNAIDLNAFAYGKEKRKKIRDEFSLGERHVYGNVANYIPVKNHDFLLRIFKEIVQLDPKAVLLCVGEGELRQEIEQKIQNLHLNGHVILTGLRNDVKDILSSLDVLLFPSIFEGLPLTLIEAQAAGLPMLISDVITEDVIVTKGLVNRLSLHDSPKEWAKKAVALAQEPTDRICQKESMAQHGYDLASLASWYEQFFAYCLSTPKEQQ